MKRIKTSPLILIAAALLLLAIIAIHFFNRTPEYFRPRQDLLTSVHKPRDVQARNLFFSPPNLLMRLDADQPSMLWTFDRSLRGFLEVSFFAMPKEEMAIVFTVTQQNEGGESRQVIHDVFRQKQGVLVYRRYHVGVALPGGGRLVFAVQPPPGSPWPSCPIGITVPRVDERQKTARPANLLIVSIDALRSDALGVYQALAGTPPMRSASPELDRFAKEAVVFLNARTTQSATWPALASLHLSQYPREHRISENGKFLSANDDSIALELLTLGYNTRAFLANAYTLNIPGFEEKWQFVHDRDLIDFVRKKITETVDAPSFYWCHLWGVHAAYSPPRWAMEALEGRDLGPAFKLQYDTDGMHRGQVPYGPDEVQAVRGLYAGALYYTDSLLKKLFNEIKSRGLWDETMIIVTADHGEELHDHNRYFYHSPSLYDSAIRVPLLIKFPHQRRQHLVEENVSLLDIFPTVYHYFVAPPPPGRFSGLSLLGVLAGAKEPFRARTLFVETELANIAAAVVGSHKLIFNPMGLMPLGQNGIPFPTAKVEFYDLGADPGEHNKLAAAGSERIRLLRAAERFLQEKGKAGKTKRGTFAVSDEMKKETEEILRTLGYIR